MALIAECVLIAGGGLRPVAPPWRFRVPPRHAGLPADGRHRNERGSLPERAAPCSVILHQEAGYQTVHDRPHAPGRRGAPCRAIGRHLSPGRPASQAGLDHLTIVTRDNSLQRAIQAAYVQPFTAATQVHVVQQVREGGIDALRSHLKAPDNTWDLDAWWTRTSLLQAAMPGCSRSSTGPPSAGKITICRRRSAIAAWGGHRQCRAGLGQGQTAVAPSWADFWDVAKYPGKRGLRKGVRGNLEIALMADGVAPGDVYKTLGSPTAWIAPSASSTSSNPISSGGRRRPRPRNSRVRRRADDQRAQRPDRPAASGHRNFGLQFAGSLYRDAKLGDHQGKCLDPKRTAIPLFYRHAGDRGAPVAARRPVRPGQGPE